MKTEIKILSHIPSVSVGRSLRCWDNTWTVSEVQNIPRKGAFICNIPHHSSFCRNAASDVEVHEGNEEDDEDHEDDVDDEYKSDEMMKLVKKMKKKMTKVIKEKTQKMAKIVKEDNE